MRHYDIKRLEGLDVHGLRVTGNTVCFTHPNGLKSELRFDSEPQFYCQGEPIPTYAEVSVQMCEMESGDDAEIPVTNMDGCLCSAEQALLGHRIARVFRRIDRGAGHRSVHLVLESPGLDVKMCNKTGATVSTKWVFREFIDIEIRYVSDEYPRLYVGKTEAEVAP